RIALTHERGDGGSVRNGTQIDHGRTSVTDGAGAPASRTLRRHAASSLVQSQRRRHGIRKRWRSRRECAAPEAHSSTFPWLRHSDLVTPSALAKAGDHSLLQAEGVCRIDSLVSLVVEAAGYASCAASRR